MGPVIAMSSLSSVIMAAFGNLFVKRFGISPFTIPFILPSWIWLLGASGSYAYFPVDGNKLSQHLNHNSITYLTPERNVYSTSEFIEAVLKGIS